MDRNREQILEELLVLRAQKGDKDSIAKLVSSWHSRFLQYATKLTGDRETAADVVQDSWMAMLKSIRKLDDPARFRSWSFRMIHNKSVDVIRKKIRRRHSRRELAESGLIKDSEIAGDGIEQAESNNDELKALRSAIGQLKPEDRSILTLFYEEALPIQEICQITGFSKSAVKSRLFQLRKKLKTVLERERDE